MSDIEMFMQKWTYKRMKATLKIIRSFTDLSEGKHSYGVGFNWLDLYTYEPLEYGKSQLTAVINALLCLAERSELNWEFRLFASDGMITTMADGSKPEGEDPCFVELVPQAD